ncbi:hypothetical protein MNBD_BACTEROID01-1982 [hydrothermal vent metagenome]|uniref:histidine kinase n=1 Tax=hydrothermal vent metagenome TaxID=652676 RepID=A0A3B0UR59_9ZZZZ
MKSFWSAVKFYWLVTLLIAGPNKTSFADVQKPLFFQYLTTADGLPQNTVDYIFQDSRGFMWFATWNGLCRYDGYNWDTFQKGESTLNFPDNFVRALCEDINGNLWVGTGKGLVIYDYIKDRFFIPDALKLQFGHLSITNISLGNKGGVFICTENHGLFKVTMGEQDENPPLVAYSIAQAESLDSVRVNTVVQLKNGLLLAGTTNEGVIVLDPETLMPVNELVGIQDAVSNFTIYAILESSKGDLWIGADGGLFRYRESVKGVSFYAHEVDNPTSICHPIINSIAEDIQGNILIGTLGGLSIFNEKENNFSNILESRDEHNGLNNEFINSLFCDKSGNVWIGTEKGGVNYYNSYQKPFYGIRHESDNINTISCNTINSIFKEGNTLWVGTAGGGLNRILNNGREIMRFEFDPENEDCISSNFVTSILRDKNQNLWIGTWGGGLNQMLSEKDNQFAVFTNFRLDPNSLSSNFISSQLELEKNRILIGSLGGLDIFQVDSKTFLHVHERMILDKTFKVGCLLMDKKDRLWIGTRYGLYCLNRKDLVKLTPQTRQIGYTKFLNQPGDSMSLAGDYITSLLEARDGTIWLGTYGNGICKYVEDGNHGYFVNYTELDGLCNNVAYAIKQDLQGNLWISTDNGLSKFNPVLETFQNYFVEDGLLSDQFYWAASYADESGMLYFGGVNGLNYFLPEDIELYPNSFKPVFTKFSIFNNQVKVGERYHSRVILEKPISETGRVELSYKDAVFSIEFSALDYFLPEKIKYAYKMEGVDQDWVIVPSTRRFANYTKLSGGEYLFQVKATNCDGVWPDQLAGLRIIVRPPFWQTAWFRFLAIIFLVAVVMAYIRYRAKFLNDQKKKLEKQVQERTQKIEEQKEEMQNQAENLRRTNQQLAERQMLIEGQKIELERQNEQIVSQRDEVIELNKKVNLVNQLRLRFFTNISHEFRTPLTLIIDPLEQLMRTIKEDKQILNTLKMINRNSQRLLHLINQLIYFRRIESGKLNLRVGKGDLAGFLENIFESFKDLAVHQQIDYQFTIGETPDESWFDPEKLENVFYNLLSNAFKYTAPGGKIEMKVSFVKNNDTVKFDLPYVKVEVIDSGKGISREHLPYIFDYFFQGGQQDAAEMKSSGIGLALTHEIVKALHGEITVESEPGHGSRFTVRLPYTSNRFVKGELDYTGNALSPNIQARVDILSQEVIHQPEEGQFEKVDNSDRSKPLLLIVEDNFDLRSFLMQTLRSDYRILGAEDGKEGFNLAKRYSPDIIISDVMMPVMDGIELCSRLKMEIQTSHIPVILLTAKAILESWIEGLETGADDYIPKPFNLQILQAKMNNLIESRRKLKRMFSRGETVSPSQLTSSSVDEEFITKVYKVLEEYYTEPDFSVKQFAQEVFVSRSLLYKKIKAITGLNITDFINSYKLKKAIDLIKASDRPISDIAFSVGFNDPKYFSRIFKKFYGMSPTELTR